MSSPNYIYFGLAGDFDPDVVAEEIGLVPTLSMAKHSRDPEKKIPRCALLRFAEVRAESEEGYFDCYNLAERVVDQLAPYTERIAGAIAKFDAEPTFQVVFEFPASEEESTPVLGFSQRVIRFVADTAASIDMDSYRGSKTSTQAEGGNG